MAEPAPIPATEEPRRFSIRPPWVIAVGAASIALVVAAISANWWDFLKIFLVLDGPILGILVARCAGSRRVIPTIFAGAVGGFLALASLGFYAVLFPPPAEPGVVNWGGRQIGAALYISLVAGLLGGFCGGIIGIFAGTTGWMVARWKMCRH